jgi:PPP family 3-phenylpropionic acid transporter
MAGINTALSMTNSLKFYMERSGHEINFGACRAIGSLAYSILSAVLGILVERVSVDSIMLGTLVISVLFLLLLIMVKVESRRFPKVEVAHTMQTEEGEHTMLSFVKENPKLMMLLVGFAFTYFTHSMITNFPNLVVQNVGGGSEAMGRVMAVMAISELPAMFLYTRISKKIPCGSLLVFSLILFTVKEFAIYLAPTMGMLYVAFALQSLSFALYTPASVHYATLVSHPRDLVKAQTFFIVAMNVAVVFASVIGGIMMDQLGVKTSLFVGVIVSAIGSVIAFFFTDKSAGKMPTP